MDSLDITPHTTVLDIVAKTRTTETIFRSYDKAAGECVLCNALFDTLENLASRYHLDLPHLLSRLRQEVMASGTEKPTIPQSPRNKGTLP